MKKKNIRKLLCTAMLSLAVASLMPNEVYAGNYATDGSTDGHWNINLTNNKASSKSYNLPKYSSLTTKKKGISLTISIEKTDSVGFADDGSFFKEVPLSVSTTKNLNPSVTYNEYVKLGKNADKGYDGSSIANGRLMRNQKVGYQGLSFNGDTANDLSFEQHAGNNGDTFMHPCNHFGGNSGCSAAVGGEFGLINGDNRCHWISAGAWGLNIDTSEKLIRGVNTSYIHNEGYLASNSYSAAEDALKHGTQVLNLISTTHAHLVFGIAKGNHTNNNKDTITVSHNPVINDGLTFKAALTKNSSYATFVIPQDTSKKADTYNIVSNIGTDGKVSNRRIRTLVKGRYVIKRNLGNILKYSNTVKKNLGIQTNGNTNSLLQVASQFATYSSGNTLKVGSQNITSNCGSDPSVGTSVAMIAADGNNIGKNYGNTTKDSILYTLNSSTSYAETRKIIPKISAVSYYNEKVIGAKSVNNRQYYNKVINSNTVEKESTFNVYNKGWILYQDTKKNGHNLSNSTLTNGISSVYAVAKSTTYTDSNQKDNTTGNNYFLSSQGDITYNGNPNKGSYALANDFVVDTVYGFVQAQALEDAGKDEGETAHMYRANTSGLNAIENTTFCIANPCLSGSTSITAKDYMHGYKLSKVNTPANTNISAESIDKDNFKITITNNTAYPIYSVNRALVSSHYMSKNDKQLYKQNGSQTLEAITKTWEQNKYTVHFITNYGYVMSSTGSNSNKTLTNLDGSDKHSFKGEAKSSDVTFTNASSANQPNGAGVSIGCDNGVNGTAKSVNIGGVTYTYYDKVYAFGSELYTNSMPNVYLRKPGTNAVNNTYKTARANNPSDNTGCVWYIATVGSDGKLQCTFADDDNLFQYLTGFKQESKTNSQVAIDLADGAEIYVVAYWAPTKNKFYLVGDDGVVYVPDEADASTPITSTDPKAYLAYRDVTNNKGDLHSDLNGDNKANELMNYVDKFRSGNSGSKFSLGKGLECNYDATKKLYYVEIFNDATFDKYGKFAGMEEGAVYENGTIIFPTGDTCYGYTFDRPNRRKYDENNNPASWLQWTRFVVPSGTDTSDKIRDEKNYVSWIETTNTLTGNVKHTNLPESYARNANSGVCLKITGTQLYKFNGAINDGYDYGTVADTDNEVFLYATWFPNTYQIEYDGNNNWNYNEILRGGSDAGNKHVESNIYYNKTINLFDGFKRDSSATDNTYNIAGQKLHDNKGSKDDLDEWKLLGYWSTSHGNVNSRITSGAEKQVGNVMFDISLNGNSRSEFNMTPGNPVRGLVDSGSISLKAIWRRAVAVSYELNGGKTVENKFLLNNAGDKSSGNDTKLYVAGYMWNDDVSIKLKVPYGEVTKNGVNDSIKKDGYRFIGWALDEAGADGTGSYKTYTDGDTVIKSVNSRLNCNENPDMTDSDSTPDLNEALNTIERYHESFTPDGNVYVDIDSVVGDKPNLVTGWDITGEQERWNAGDRSKGCNGRIEIPSSVFDVGDVANNPFSTKVGNSEATGNNPYVEYGCGLPSKNLDVYASKNMRGDLNNDSGYSKDEEIDVTNSVVAHAMWEGILQARVTYSIQNDERKTLQYSAMNKDNYESSYIKREYNGNGTVLCGSLLENSGRLGNDITKAADAIDSVQGGNLFETSVSETTAITDLADLVMVRQYSSKDVYIDSDGKLVKRGSGSEDTTLDRQYSFDNESKTWSSPISKLTLAEAVKGTYESHNDLLNKPENSEASEDSGLAVVGKIGSGDGNKTTLISALNGFNANNQNKYYGFYRQNMFSGSPKLSVDNYDQLYVKYKEYIPLYLHYTMNPNANDRKFLTKCARGEGGSYVIQTELRKFSFYYSVHSSNNTGNEYKAETIRIPVRLNIYASETNTSGPVPPVPDPPSGGGKGGNDPSHPTSQGGGVKSTLDLPEQTQ